MKKFLLVILLAAFATGASAQRYYRHDNPVFSFRKAEQPVSFGVRVGVNFAGIADNNKDFDKTRTGFNVGASMDLPIFQSLYLQSGLYFTTKGAKVGKPKSSGDLNWFEGRINPCYLELPIYASWRLDFSKNIQLQVNVGPYFAVGLGGNYKWSSGVSQTVNGETLSVEDSGKEPLFRAKGNYYHLRRGDIGLGIGGGLTFYHVFVGVNYSFGFNNLKKDLNDGSNLDGLKFRNRNFTIQAGFNFGPKKKR